MPVGPVGHNYLMKTTGTVRWYDKNKGYGFVRPDDGSVEHFIHASGIADVGYVPEEGDRLIYEMVHTPKGPKADNVSRLGE